MTTRSYSSSLFLFTNKNHSEKLLLSKDEANEEPIDPSAFSETGVGIRFVGKHSLSIIFDFYGERSLNVSAWKKDFMAS